MGKSAYMLFYERRKKKPLKVLLPTEQQPKEEVKAVDSDEEEIAPISITRTKSTMVDAKTNEHYKMIPYHQGIDEAPPNDIYNKVEEDNSKFTFENDVYSDQFF